MVLERHGEGLIYARLRHRFPFARPVAGRHAPAILTHRTAAFADCRNAKLESAAAGRTPLAQRAWLAAAGLARMLHRVDRTLEAKDGT
jgi:hypothetical protein